MKKNTKIGIAVLCGLVVLGIMFVTMIVMFFTSMLNKYEFTTEELKVEYENVEGYTQYKDEYISFKYPSDWINGSDLTEYPNDVIFVENMDPAKTPNISYRVYREDELNLTEEDYNPLKFSVNSSSSIVSGKKVAVTSAERWLEVNDKKTYMEYVAGNSSEYTDESRYNLAYYSFIDNDKILYIYMSAENEEQFEVMAASLDY